MGRHLAEQSYAPSPLNITDWEVDRDAGRLVLPRARRSNVCIYGAGLGHRDAPLEDPEWEVWALNVIPPVDGEGRLRADRWFELHQRKAQSDLDMRWIAACPCPIYVPPDLMGASPRAVRYPLEEMEGQFGGGYWACTFAYQIALALSEGVAGIGLFGVELAWGTERERSVEWACVSWWLGVAQGRGVQVYVPRGSMLGRHRYRYGFEYDEEKAHVERYVQTLSRVAEPHRRGVGG